MVKHEKHPLKVLGPAYHQLHPALSLNIQVIISKKVRRERRSPSSSPSPQATGMPWIRAVGWERAKQE